MAGSLARLPALILLGHGARDPEWRRPIDAIRTCLTERQLQTRVEIAFHEFIGPTLADTVALLHAAGHREIVVVPVFIAQGGHLRQEVPAQIESLRRRYPDCRFTLESAVGESPEVQDAIAAHCATLLESSRQKN
jgi:sirohydrochlorin cobaltochelatase